MGPVDRFGIPPFELWKTDHGIDGWDAKTTMVARFTTHAKALAYLKSIGYGYKQHGWYYSDQLALRHTMGMLTYDIRDKKPDVPVDPF